MSTLKSKAQSILNEKKDKIIPENIKSGVQVFDVVGTLEEGIDTSDATANISDIAYGKTAYVNGRKISGMINTYSSGSAINIDNNSYEYRLYHNAISKQLYWDNNNIDRLLRLGSKITIPDTAWQGVVGLNANILKKGSTVGTLTGTYEPDAYVYNNVAQLLADTNPSVGKLGIVYTKGTKQAVSRGKTYTYLYVSEMLENQSSDLFGQIPVDGGVSWLEGMYYSSDGKVEINQTFDLYSGSIQIILNVENGASYDNYDIQIEGGTLEDDGSGMQVVDYTSAYVSSATYTLVDGSTGDLDLDTMIELHSPIVLDNSSSSNDFITRFNCWLQAGEEESITKIYRKTSNSWEDISNKIHIN